MASLPIQYTNIFDDFVAHLSPHTSSVSQSQSFLSVFAAFNLTEVSSLSLLA